jgi:hypothetical protein
MNNMSAIRPQGVCRRQKAMQQPYRVGLRTSFKKETWTNHTHTNTTNKTETKKKKNVNKTKRFIKQITVNEVAGMTDTVNYHELLLLSAL